MLQTQLTKDSNSPSLNVACGFPEIKITFGTHNTNNNTPEKSAEQISYG